MASAGYAGAFPHEAVLQICDDNDLDSTSLRHAPLSMIETLQEAAYQQMQAEVGQMAASSQLPEAQEQALDEYPTPDEQVSTPDMQKYGYSYDGMLLLQENGRWNWMLPV